MHFKNQEREMRIRKLRQAVFFSLISIIIIMSVYHAFSIHNKNLQIRMLEYQHEIDIANSAEIIKRIITPKDTLNH